MWRAVVWTVLAASCAAGFYWYGDTRTGELTVGFDAPATARSLLVTLFVPFPLLLAGATFMLLGLRAVVRTQRPDFVKCLNCGYSSREVPRVDCPECGRTRREAERELRALTFRSIGEASLAALIGILVGSIAAETWLLAEDEALQHRVPIAGSAVTVRAAPFGHRPVGVPVPSTSAAAPKTPLRASTMPPLALDDASPDPQVVGPDRLSTGRVDR